MPETTGIISAYEATCLRLFEPRTAKRGVSTSRFFPVTVTMAPRPQHRGRVRPTACMFKPSAVHEQKPSVCTLLVRITLVYPWRPCDCHAGMFLHAHSLGREARAYAISSRALMCRGLQIQQHRHDPPPLPSRPLPPFPRVFLYARGLRLCWRLDHTHSGVWSVQESSDTEVLAVRRHGT